MPPQQIKLQQLNNNNHHHSNTNPFYSIDALVIPDVVAIVVVHPKPRLPTRAWYSGMNPNSRHSSRQEQRISSYQQQQQQHSSSLRQQTRRLLKWDGYYSYKRLHNDATNDDDDNNNNDDDIFTRQLIPQLLILPIENSTSAVLPQQQQEEEEVRPCTTTITVNRLPILAWTLRRWEQPTATATATSSASGRNETVTTTTTTSPTTTTTPPPNQQQQQQRPIPTMPSVLFQQLASSQMEFLASSLIVASSSSSSNGSDVSKNSPHNRSSKIKSIVLYLPQENERTGQLEFLPMIVYPNHHGKERIFIANEWDSGIPLILPQIITKLPGFAPATTLLPRYPMIDSSYLVPATTTTRTNDPSRQQSSSQPGIGRVEEVYSEWRSGTTLTSLSVPLLVGSQTVGVLLVSPQQQQQQHSASGASSTSTLVATPFWTEYDRQQVTRAATSISLALSMDMEQRRNEQNRNIEMEQQRQYYNSLSDNLHQLKNPIQALRTYGKLLQRRLVDVSYGRNDTTTVASSGDMYNRNKNNNTGHLLELADHLMQQSDRIVERLKPVDRIVENMSQNNSNNNFDNTNPSMIVGLLLPSTAPIIRQQSIVPYVPPRLRNDDATDDSILLQTSRVADPFHPYPISKAPPIDDDCYHIANEIVNSLDEGGLEMSFVSDVLESIFHDFHIIAIEQGIDFRILMDDVDTIPGVTINPKALQEVMINLLDNAFKYVKIVEKKKSHSSENCKPQVRVRIYSNEYNRNHTRSGVTIIVEDNGIGIPIDDIDRVFDRGYRNPIHIARSSEEDDDGGGGGGVDGSGIGLTIAQSYVQQMGGTLRTIVVEPQNKPGNEQLHEIKVPSSSSSLSTISSRPYLSGAIMELVLFR